MADAGDLTFVPPGTSGDALATILLIVASRPPGGRVLPESPSYRPCCLATRRGRMIFGPEADYFKGQERFMSISSGAVAITLSAQPDRAALAFLYEHPQWFAAIFAELERRKVPFDKIFIPDHFYEVGPQKPAFKVLFNRMSPSANSRQHGSGIFHTLGLSRAPAAAGRARASTAPRHFAMKFPRRPGFVVEIAGSSISALAHHSFASSGGRRGGRFALSHHRQGQHRRAAARGSHASTPRANWRPRSRPDNWI